MCSYLDILSQTIRENWNKLALTDYYLAENKGKQDALRGCRYTYGEMYIEICRVAELLGSLGLQKGDHIAICGTNSSNWIISYLAIAKIQGVAVVIMHSLPETQIAQLLDFSDSKVLFVDNLVREKISIHTSSRKQTIIDIETLTIVNEKKVNTIVPCSSVSKIEFGNINSDDPAMICFTSGSTERPKAVLLANRTISANYEFVERTIPNYKGQNALVFLPLAHVMGLLLLSPLCYGCSTYILREAITAESLLVAIADIKPYLLVLVPLLAEILLRKSNINPLRFVSYFIVGGASLSNEQMNRLVQKGIRFSVGYGMTETGGMVSLSAPDSFREGSSGYPSDTSDVRIANNGEILVKGENVMLGYYKDPEATAAKIDSEGWLHTGDKGHLDEDGYLYVEGRMEQDIIVLPNGENIRPEDIESKINAIPEVKESIVFAREGKLVAIVVCDTQKIDRRFILRTINPQLPLYSQIYDAELTDIPLARTDKQTLKRYFYK